MAKFLRVNGHLYRELDTTSIKINKVAKSARSDDIVEVEANVNGKDHIIQFSLHENGQLGTAYQFNGKGNLTHSELKSVEALVKSKYNKQFTQGKVDVTRIEEMQQAGRYIRVLQDELLDLNQVLQEGKTKWQPSNGNISQVLAGYKRIQSAIERFARSSTLRKTRELIDISLKKAAHYKLG